MKHANARSGHHGTQNRKQRPPSQTGAGGGTLGIPRSRLWLFRALAVLGPLMLLAGVEGICRLCGLGGYPPVIVHMADDGPHRWYATNRPGTDTFFDTRSARAGGMREVHFTTPKPTDTVRIIFLGGSAMQGFPQELPLTNGAFLEAMLDDLWAGEKKAEVLNFGATAVASFPILCYLDEVLQHDPDLIVLMAGNNEFYGAYGVASMYTGGRTPTAMKLTRWLGRQGLIQRIRKLRSPETRRDGALMEQVVAQARIAPDDPLRTAAQSSLRDNLTEIVSRCRARGVPVIVCILPTNERGLAPIGECQHPELTPGQQAEFVRKLAAAEAALGANAKEAVQLADACIKLCPDDAEAHFLRGVALTALNEHDDALAEYILARDLDTMPWRATSAAQRAVRDAADAGGILCDMEAAFRADSPGGAIGWELMDDHVHLSLRGQALFARTIAEVLSTLSDRLHVNPPGLAALPDWKTYADRLGRDIYIELMAAERIDGVFGIPFMSRSNRLAAERAHQRVEELVTQMSPRDREAWARRLDPELKGYTDYPLSLAVGGYRFEDGDYAVAARLFETARASVPAISLWRIQSNWYLLKSHQRLGLDPTANDVRLCNEAIHASRLLLQHADRDTSLVRRYLGLLYHLAGDDAAAVGPLEESLRTASGSDSVEVLISLVNAYIRLGRADDARRQLIAALRNPQLAEPAQALLSRIDAASSETP